MSAASHVLRTTMHQYSGTLVLTLVARLQGKIHTHTGRPFKHHAPSCGSTQPQGHMLASKVLIQTVAPQLATYGPSNLAYNLWPFKRASCRPLARELRPFNLWHTTRGPTDMRAAALRYVSSGPSIFGIQPVALKTCELQLLGT